MSLLIKGVTAEDAGAYEICAANEMGMDTQQMNLIVKSKYFFFNLVKKLIQNLFSSTKDPETKRLYLYCRRSIQNGN